METDTAVHAPDLRQHTVRRFALVLILLVGALAAGDALAQRQPRGRSASADSTRAVRPPVSRDRAERGTVSRTPADRPDRSTARGADSRQGATRERGDATDRSAARGADRSTVGNRDGRTESHPSNDAPHGDGGATRERTDPLHRPGTSTGPIDPPSSRARTGERDARVVRRAPSSAERRVPAQPVVRRPRVRVDIAWPWEYRLRYGWAPRYRYRQVVRYAAGWAEHQRDARLEVRTEYRHRVLRVGPGSADVEIEIDRIDLYDDGYYIGMVRRIPSTLSRVRATIFRSGRVDFDGDLLLVGDPYAGFELIASRHYDGWIFDHFRRNDTYRAGVLDLRRERVVSVRRSRLFDPYRFDGFVPLSLLPDDTRGLFDYGYHAPSAPRYYDDPAYEYYGNDPYLDDEDRPYRQERGATLGDDEATPLRDTDRREFDARDGARVRIERDTELQRIE